MNRCLSYGGGVNSTALALFLADKGVDFKMVFADTGVELPETISYMKYFQSTTGLHVDVVKQEYVNIKNPIDCRKRGLYDYCWHYKMVPLMHRRWCTAKFKINPIYFYLEKNNIEEQLIGFDAGEAHRAENKAVHFCEQRYPLIENGINRDGCVDIIKAHGLAIPQKSGCFICPFQRKKQWKHLFHKHNDLWNDAVELEQRAVHSNKNRATFFSNNITLLDVKKDWALADRQGHFWGDPCLCYE